MDGLALDRYVRAAAMDDIPRPKELDAAIEIEPTDAFADELAAAADEVGALPFAIYETGLLAFAKVSGNPWDLHDVLEGLCRLSRRFPELLFKLRFNPDGADGTLRAGELAIEGATELARWVVAHPRPQYAGGAVTGRVTCLIGEPERTRLREAIARMTPTPIADIDDGLVLEIAHLHDLKLATYAVRSIMFAAGWQVRIELAGDVTWTITVDGLVSLLALDTVIATWLRDAKPSAPPAPPAFSPAPAPELARLVHPDRLVIELDNDQSFTLRDDGTFEPMPPRAARVQGHTLGAIAEGTVVAQQLEVALGRLRHAIVIRATDGTQRESAPLINASAFVFDIDRSRVLASRELDGSPELVAIDVATLEITTLRPLAALAPKALFVHVGALVALDVRGPEIRLVRLAERGGTDITLATLAGRVSQWERHGDVVDIVATDAVDTPDASYLHRIALADGSVRTIQLGRGRTVMRTTAGAWSAWTGRDDARVHIFEELELRRSVPAPAGFDVWSIDISPIGTLVRVMANESIARLDVIRAEATAEIAVPPRTTGKWQREA